MKFEAEDFLSDSVITVFMRENFPDWKEFMEAIAEHHANHANAILQKWLEEATVVYGEAMKRGPLKGEVWDWHDDACQNGTDTHRAKLVCVEELVSHKTIPIEPNLDDVCDHGLMKTTPCRLCDQGDL